MARVDLDSRSLNTTGTGRGSECCGFKACVPRLLCSNTSVTDCTNSCCRGVRVATITAKMARNGTNLGFIQISFQYILVHRAENVMKADLKSPI